MLVETNSYARERYPLWPIVLICLVSITSGAVKIAGLPTATVFPSIVALVLLFTMQKVLMYPVLFASFLLAGMVPGALLAASDGMIELASVANLLAGLFAFVVVYTYVYKMLNNNNNNNNNNIVIYPVNFTLILFLFLALSELLFYDSFCSVRKYLFHGVVEGIICQGSGLGREATLYGFPRPSAIFSEPSNFARFISIFVAIHYILSEKKIASLIWFGVFFVLTRSPTFLYATPVIAMSFLYSIKSSSGFKLSIGRSSIIILPVAILGSIFYALQSERINLALRGDDDSLGSRIVNPFRFMVDQWEQPFFGSGPTPYEMVDHYVSEFFIHATGRYWLLDVGYTNAISPTPLLLISWGVLGVYIVLLGNGLAFGSRGIGLLFLFLATNLLNTGASSPIMYVPSAVVMALGAYVWRPTEGLFSAPPVNRRGKLTRYWSNGA